MGQAHCTDYPAYQARFVLGARLRVHPGWPRPKRESPAMRVENLRSSYLHDMSIYGEESWLLKHRGYAKSEAARCRERWRPGPRVLGRASFNEDPLVRRRALKEGSASSSSLPPGRHSGSSTSIGLRLGFHDGPQARLPATVCSSHATRDSFQRKLPYCAKGTRCAIHPNRKISLLLLAADLVSVVLIFNLVILP